jgi:hypothetical protein
VEVEVKVDGLKELMAQMDGFVSPLAQKALVNKAVHAGVQVMKKAAIANLGKGSKYIVEVTPKKKRWGGATVASVGLGFSKSHWQVTFIEHGARPHEIVAGLKRKKYPTGKKALGIRGQFGKRVQHPGQKKRPFLKPVAQTHLQATVNKIRDSLHDDVERIFKERHYTFSPSFYVKED